MRRVLSLLGFLMVLAAPTAVSAVTMLVSIVGTTVRGADIAIYWTACIPSVGCLTGETVAPMSVEAQSSTNRRIENDAKAKLATEGITVDGDVQIIGGRALDAPADPWTTLTVSADVNNSSNVTLSDVTGIALTVAANTNYLIECWLIVRSAATTTGFAFAWNTPASPNQILTSYVHSLAATGTVTAGFSAADDTVGGVTSGIDALGVDRLVRLSTLFRNGANGGTTQLRVRSEINASQVTVKQNAVCQYRSY